MALTKLFVMLGVFLMMVEGRMLRWPLFSRGTNRSHVKIEPLTAPPATETPQKTLAQLEAERDKMLAEAPDLVRTADAYQDLPSAASTNAAHKALEESMKDTKFQQTPRTQGNTGWSSTFFGWFAKDGFLRRCITIPLYHRILSLLPSRETSKRVEPAPSQGRQNAPARKVFEGHFSSPGASGVAKAMEPRRAAAAAAAAAKSEAEAKVDSPQKSRLVNRLLGTFSSSSQAADAQAEAHEAMAALHMRKEKLDELDGKITDFAGQADDFRANAIRIRQQAERDPVNRVIEGAYAACGGTIAEAAATRIAAVFTKRSR